MIEKDAPELEIPTGEKIQRPKTKTLTKRFLQAIYARSEAEMLPLHYFRTEAEKFCPPEEVEKLEPMLQAMVDGGEAEREDDAFQLLKT